MPFVRYDISFKDWTIFFKVMVFFTPWPELFPVTWTMAYKPETSLVSIDIVATYPLRSDRKTTLQETT